MPTTYAHWRFGKDCIKTMPENLKTLCERYRGLFDLGVHGPDIFFYNVFNPGMPTYGGNMHHISGKFVFKDMKEAYKKHKEEKSLVYLLGFLSHYTFDSCAHGYVERKKEISEVSHNKIEADYDRHLIKLDNLKHYNRSSSIKPTKDNAKVISYFFPYEEKEIHKTIKTQKFFLSLINCNNDLSRYLIKKFLIMNKMEENCDLIMDAKEYPPCKDSNVRLDKLYAKALSTYPRLLTNFINYLEDKEELEAYFDKDFNHGSEYKDIQILDYYSELTYKV